MTLFEWYSFEDDDHTYGYTLFMPLHIFKTKWMEVPMYWGISIMRYSEKGNPSNAILGICEAKDGDAISFPENEIDRYSREYAIKDIFFTKWKETLENRIAAYKPFQ